MLKRKLLPKVLKQFNYSFYHPILLIIASKNDYAKLEKVIVFFIFIIEEACLAKNFSLLNYHFSPKSLFDKH